jgi:cleavage and polyadenylation specificity factor subunit 3
MFLEAQFGADNVAPVKEPRLPVVPDAEEVKENGSDASMELSDSDGEQEKSLQKRHMEEIERLHKLGIPVPGVSVKVDKMTATVWLEDLEVESNNKVFADRVKAVVERAAEVTAPLWG